MATSACFNPGGHSNAAGDQLRLQAPSASMASSPHITATCPAVSPLIKLDSRAMYRPHAWMHACMHACMCPWKRAVGRRKQRGAAAVPGPAKGGLPLEERAMRIGRRRRRRTWGTHTGMMLCAWAHACARECCGAASFPCLPCQTVHTRCFAPVQKPTRASAPSRVFVVCIAAAVTTPGSHAFLALWS